ncbi:MAG: hypothetical protein KAQ63_02520, partial [Candidatus Moranbacteria bacterium]|nr:hypothetical protein [Candidatus Moranbacteria bacterium]
GEIEIVDIQLKYLEINELKVEKIEGEWLDAGTFDSLLDASNLVKEKKLYKNFDKTIEKAILNYNQKLKEIAKRKII